MRQTCGENLAVTCTGRHIGVDRHNRFAHNRGSLVERVDLRHVSRFNSATLQRIASVEIYLNAIGGWIPCQARRVDRLEKFRQLEKVRR